MIYFDTSGLSYNDWVEMSKREWLTYYMAQFPCSLRFNHRNRDYFFTNNHRRGQAVSTIRHQRMMLA